MPHCHSVLRSVLAAACLLAISFATAAGADEVPATPASAAAVAPTASPAVNLPDPVVLEAALQALDWPSFRHVIESVPKLRADVDAYGAFGWEYVKSHYTTCRWRKNIGRLKDDQKRQLAELIAQAQRH